MKKAILVLVSVLALFLLASCSGGKIQEDDAQAEGEQTSAGQAGIATGEGTGAAAEEAVEGAAEESAESSGSALDEVKSMITRKAMDYKIAYEVKAAGATTKMTMAYKGTSKMRIDTEVAGQKSSVFLLDGKAYMCMEQPQAICYSTTYAQSAGSESIEQEIDSYTITDLPSRIITGVSAKCYTWKKGSVSVDMCYSADGATLYMKTAQSEMTATSYSAGVPDSYFELPVQPQQLPTG